MDTPIIDQLSLSKNHIVMKFTPFSPELHKNSFIVAFEIVSKFTPSRLANILQESIKYLSTYKFDMCDVTFDGAT